MTNKLMSAIIITLMLSVSPAFAQIEWGSDAPTPIQGTGATETAETTGQQVQPGQPQPPPDTWYYYTGPGTKQVLVENTLTTEQLNTRYPGHTYAGQYQLTAENVRFLQAYAKENNDAKPELDQYKVSFENQDGTHDVSVGLRNFDDWQGKDEFSSGEDPLEIYYDGDKITITRTAENWFKLEDGTEVQGVSGGAVHYKEEETVFYNSEGGTVNSFDNDEWEDWKPIFQAAGPSNLVPLAFTIDDLSLDPDDVKGSFPDRSGVYGDDFIIRHTEGTVNVQRGGEFDRRTGTMTGDYTSETYTMVDGKKDIGKLTYYKDGKITADYVYPKGENKQLIITKYEDGKATTIAATQVTYTGVKGEFLLLGNVGAVQVVHAENGDMKYFKNGKELSEKEASEFEEKNEEKLDELSEKNDEITAAEGEKDYQELPPEKRERFHSFGQFLTDFVQYYRQFSGMAGWSSLIFDEEFLKDWRDKVNDLMCESLGIPLTKACWVSEVCGEYSDIEPTKDGVLFSTPVGGAPAAVAHIEGRRSLPIVAPNETSWVYTITYSISNPTDKTMNYNIRFAGPQKSALWWHESPNTLPKGTSSSATGSSAILKHSPNNYNSVCLEFNPKIEGFDGKRVGKLCNSIVQVAPVATSPYYEEEEKDETETPGVSSPTTTSAPGATV